MSDFKKNIQKITSDKPSDWKDRSNERLNKPWLKQYSSQIARRILSLIEGDEELSQVKLAKAVGVSAQQINKIIKGRENMTLETIFKLSKALNFELISFPPYKYSRPEKYSTSYNLTIDSKSHLISKEEMDNIYNYLGMQSFAKQGYQKASRISSDIAESKINLA